MKIKTTPKKNTQKNIWRRIWYFIWEDDSVWSWIVNVILAFVLIKFIVYPGLGLLLGTQFPIVAVISESMDHSPAGNSICGHAVDDTYKSNLDGFWSACGSWYESRNISKSEFSTYRLSNGFKRGDIIFLYGKKPEDIKRGAIIVFSAANVNRKPDPIIHRVVAVDYETNTFTTKGDHNPSSIKDSTIAEHAIGEERILGVALFKVPYLGYVKIIAVEVIQGFMRKLK